MLQFIKKLFKDKEKERMQKLLKDLLVKASYGQQELIVDKDGNTQVIYTVRIPRSFMQECARYAKKVR